MNTIETIKNFLKAIEDGKTGADLMQYYHEEIIQTEYPNFLTKQTVTRDYDAINAASISGQHVLQSQTYEIIALHEAGDTVVLESIWRGILNVPFGNYAVGDTMIAHFAQIYTFKDGKIFRQKNYDCFEVI